MRWSINTGPFLLLHAKPQLVNTERYPIRQLYHNIEQFIKQKKCCSDYHGIAEKLTLRFPSTKALGAVFPLLP